MLFSTSTRDNKIVKLSGPYQSLLHLGIFLFQTRYEEEIFLLIKQNPDTRLVLTASGEGAEPEITFNSGVLHFGPVLPYSAGATREVTIFNSTKFPVEFYSLEYDNQYLDEEEVSLIESKLLL